MDTPLKIDAKAPVQKPKPRPALYRCGTCSAISMASDPACCLDPWPLKLCQCPDCKNLQAKACDSSADCWEASLSPMCERCREYYHNQLKLNKLNEY